MLIIMMVVNADGDNYDVYDGGECWCNDGGECWYNDGGDDES